MSGNPAKPRSGGEDAVQIVRTLRAAGHVAYLAGGCVRDTLLGLPPKDYDVATDAPPDRVRQLFQNTQAVGAAFGVMLVRVGGSVIEVATFRSDGAYADGRRPDSVTFTDAEHDAQRRDFTINGLFYDPIEHRIIDYVNGQADLQARVLRAIGKPAERFNEDYLRLLRAVRFAARFRLTIDPQTAAAIDAAAPNLARISGERIADELRRMLTAETRDWAFRLLWQHRLLDAILSGTSVHQSLEEPRSVFLHVSPSQEISFGLAWLAVSVDHRFQTGGMTHDLLGNFNAEQTAGLVRAARTMLKLSNGELDEMTDVARHVHMLLNTPEPRVAVLKRFLAHPAAASSRAILNALRATGFASERIAMLNARLDELKLTDIAPAPFVTGDELVAIGFSPGPRFKDAMNQTYDAQLEGRVVDRSSAIAMAAAILRSGG